MTLKQLLTSVDAEGYAENPLFQALLKVKPEYGSDRRIKISVREGEIVVSNVHVGSWGDIVTYHIDVAPQVTLTNVHVLDAILAEMSSESYSDADQTDFWNEMTNLQKAKIIR